MVKGKFSGKRIFDGVPIAVGIHDIVVNAVVIHPAFVGILANVLQVINERKLIAEAITRAEIKADVVTDILIEPIVPNAGIQCKRIVVVGGNVKPTAVNLWVVRKTAFLSRLVKIVGFKWIYLKTAADIMIFFVRGIDVYTHIGFLCAPGGIVEFRVIIGVDVKAVERFVRIQNTVICICIDIVIIVDEQNAHVVDVVFVGNIGAVHVKTVFSADFAEIQIAGVSVKVFRDFVNMAEFEISRQFIGIRSCIQVKQESRNVGIPKIAVSHHIGVDKSKRGILPKTLIEYQYVVIG